MAPTISALAGPGTSNSALVPVSGSRSRPQARKKANDDAAYFGSLGGAGTKRHAGEKADGEPRVKRKRVDASGVGTSVSAGGRRVDKDKIAHEGDLKASLIEFTTMPTATLYRYLTQFELIPAVYPPPISGDDPPAPSSLEHPARHTSRAASPALTTPANRPRRESKEQSKRRSSRLLEEEIQSRTPILADIADVHGILARIADRHWREYTVKEVDTLATFMSRVAGEKPMGRVY